MDSEIIDISDFGSNGLGLSKENSDLKSTNFGPGIELLMSGKKMKSSTTHDSDNEIFNLEKELNELTDSTDDIFKPSVDFKMPISELETVKIGEDTLNNNNDEKTWDGFSKFNNIPINPDKQITSQPNMSKEEAIYENWNN